MWVNKVPNVHVWADHTSVKLLLGIRARASSLVPPRPVWQSGAETPSTPMVVQHFLFRSRLNLLLQKKKQHVTATWTFLALAFTQQQLHCAAQTQVSSSEAAAAAVSPGRLTSVWSRHRNPLALKKLPPSLCLTSNGAFFSSLSFFMFVCKVLYITWIYYAHILPNG